MNGPRDHWDLGAPEHARCEECGTEFAAFLGEAWRDGLICPDCGKRICSGCEDVLAPAGEELCAECEAWTHDEIHVERSAHAFAGGPGEE